MARADEHPICPLIYAGIWHTKAAALKGVLARLESVEHHLA
jgi:hypothetical protein